MVVTAQLPPQRRPSELPTPTSASSDRSHSTFEEHGELFGFATFHVESMGAAVMDQSAGVCDDATPRPATPRDLRKLRYHSIQSQMVCIKCVMPVACDMVVQMCKS